MRCLNPAVAVSLVALEFLIGTSPATASDQPLVLVQNGIARCVIVVGADAPTPAYSAIPAGQVLQRYLEKVSGAKVPLVSEDGLRPDDVSGKVLVLLGDGRRVRRLGLSRQGLDAEGFLVKTVGDCLVILGGDDRALKGTYYGTLAFLERSLGIRWLLPFDVGEVVPRQKTITVGPLDFKDAPRFAVRNFRNQYDNGGLWQVSKPYMGDEKRHLQLAQRAAEWFSLQRLAYGVKLNGGHSNENWFEKYGKTHPAFFAQQPDGRRFVPARYAGYAKLCVSNPTVIQAVVDEALAELKKNPQLESIGISPNDGGDWGYCMCPECKKWDDPRGQKLTFRPTYETPTFEYVSLSDRYARFYSEVAERVCKQYPHVLVVGMAYGHYTAAPRQTRLHPNVVILYVGGDVYYSDRERAVVRRDLVGWGKAGARLAWRPNWLRQDGWPITYPHKLAEDVRALYHMGMRYGDFDTCVNDWGAGGLNYYVLARLLWDPGQDVDALIDDYCRKGFGPAAPAMKRHFACLEEASSQVAAVFDDKGDWYPIAERLYTPAFFESAYARLKEADTLAGRGDDPPAIRRRIDLFRQAMQWTEIHVEQLKAVRALREKRGDRATCEALLARREQWYKDHLYTEALPVPYIRWQDMRAKAYLEP